MEKELLKIIEKFLKEIKRTNNERIKWAVKMNKQQPGWHVSICEDSFVNFARYLKGEPLN